MDGWMDGLTHEWIDGQMYGCISMEGWMEGYTDG